MWVDIANLVGPQGNPGKDGDKGDPGPVNIGLDPNSPIGWDQTGGFTFNFVDGSEQTVNLPIASAQSAGLLAAGGAMPRTPETDIAADDPKVGSGSATICRVGPIVEMTLAQVTVTSDSQNGIDFATYLPPGYRPPLHRRFVVSNGTNTTTVRPLVVFPYGAIRVYGTIRGSDRIDGTVAWTTQDRWPET